MIFWHVGVTMAVVRYAFRDPAMDLRWVAAGSLLPDVLDKPIGSILFVDTFDSHRLFGHALAFPVVGLFVVLAVTRRGTALRKGLIGLVVGTLVHLVLDGAWADPEALWWPLFGFDFPQRVPASLAPLLRDMASDWRVWVGEAVGLLYLVYVWWVYLREEGAVRRFMAEDGRLPMPTAR